MKNIKILDCTLRDGGYINNFEFGKKAIADIINKLSLASVEIIECGFLKSHAIDENCSLYSSVDAIKDVIKIKKINTMYVAMIQYGEISNEDIIPYNGTSIDGIRLTFHEHEIDEAFILGRQLMEKGYKVFIQPVGTATYTDEALLNLIHRVNKMKPFAFYLVDTLGALYKNDTLRLFYLIDHNLDQQIMVGFHSHNNLQLSFSNAQELMLLNSPRKIIIDTSVFGMGRGAGNLCTELLTQYINQNIGHKYDVLPILEILDEYINPIYLKYNWGYSVPYYLAAINNCHPNYTTYLLNKQTLSVKEISGVIKTIDKAQGILFNKKYAESLYIEFQKHNVNDSENVELLSSMFHERTILILAPGKSLDIYSDDLDIYIKKNNPIIISVNFIPSNIKIDALFVSNLKRFKNIENLSEFTLNSMVICTSNITTSPNDNMIVMNYANYLNEESVISDNAGLMLINMLTKIGIEKIVLAGFDGYSINKQDNFFEDNLIVTIDDERLISMNQAISNKIKQLKNAIKIEFLTKSIYE